MPQSLQPGLGISKKAHLDSAFSRTDFTDITYYGNYSFAPFGDAKLYLVALARKRP